ncbi:MAG: PIG-L family deacetylase [Candidatus Acidiferrum sp.]
MRFLKSFALVLLLVLLRVPPTVAQFPPAPGTGPGLPETIEAIDSARVTTRILYITAHPDDESAAVLTYLARGLHADVALLSITRGEGGQNALGPEQAPQLGLIRTQELLAAARGYGVTLYFTRARDFGYSKTPEETEKIWGDQVLEDMVRVICSFRPNIVINGWGGVHSGHGHHQVSGIWTPKAVALAADPNAFPDLRKEGFLPWNGAESAVQILDVERGSQKPTGHVLPLDDVSPLYGKSWRQIGLDAFVNHRSQGIAGFINSPFLMRPIALLREDGKNFDSSTLAVPLTELFGKEDGKVCSVHKDWCEKLRASDSKLAEARTAALKLDWPGVTDLLVQAQKSLDSLRSVDLMSSYGPLGRVGEADVLQQTDDIHRAVLLAAGFEVRAEADRDEVVLKELFTVTVSYHCRPGVKCPVQGPAVIWANSDEFRSTSGSPEKGQVFSVTIDSLSAPLSPLQQLDPERPTVATAFLTDDIDPMRKHPITAPVIHTEATSTSAVRVPVHLVPAYTLAVQPAQSIEVLNAEHKPFDIFLRAHSYSTKPAKVTVGLDVPDGLHASAPVDLTFDGVGDQYAKFTVTPPAKLAPGDFTITAYAKRGDETFSTSLEPLPSMPSILWSEPSQCIVHAFDITVPPHLRVGYISAEGEPIPDALKRLGISVDLLDPTALAFGNLSIYDAIVVGVRAYELRPELAGANKRLLDYVSGGGTLVVQYNRDFVWDKLQPAPYPAKIGSPTPRVTDETAEVKFLQPADPLLNSPNKITAADFNNWVQERGLYYWSVFDSRYTPLLAMHDPGENDLNGSLVYARYGNGTYIYTGLSFFRQLPEGNSGAYRLFVNLISASRTRQASATH